MGAVVLDTVRVDLSVQLLKERLKVIGTNYKLATAYQIYVLFIPSISCEYNPQSSALFC